MNKIPLHLLRQYFKKNPHINGVFIYGSHAKKQANKLSDLDIGVLLKNTPHRDELETQLQIISDLQDLLPNKDLDVKILNHQNLPLKFLHQVVTTGKLIYVSDKNSVENFKLKIISEYLDFLPVLKNYYHHMNQRIKQGTYAAN